MEPSISIIIITYNRTELLRRCLESISSCMLPENYELIVIINGTETNTLNFLQSLSLNKINLHFYSIERSSNGRARNEGIKYARGEILYFLDDDIIINKNIFEAAINKFREYPGVDIMGGPNLSPPDNNLFQRCCGYVFSSVFGSAKLRYRYMKGLLDRLVDDNFLILCNLAIRKKVFDKERLLFNERLICNEENLLLQQLRLKGHKMLYSPDLVVYHDRRSTLRGLFQQIFKYGKGRMQQTLYLPKSLTLFNILPSLFVLYLISLIFFHKFFYLCLLFIYLILDIFFSLQIVLRHKNLILFPLSLIIFPIVHISYGLGFVSGLLIKHDDKN